MKKILLTGTTSAGKTTFLNMLVEHQLFAERNMIVIPEYARELLEAYPELEQDPRLQDMLFAEQVSREIAAEGKHPELIICDRGVLDTCAHSSYFGIPIKAEWRAWSKQAYDVVLFLEKSDIEYQVTELQLLIDPTRDWVAERQRLDQHIHQAIIESGLPWQKLQGSREGRLAWFVDWLEGQTTHPESRRSYGKELR